jgi:hypothetical protein
MMVRIDGRRPVVETRLLPIEGLGLEQGELSRIACGSASETTDSAICWMGIEDGRHATSLGTTPGNLPGTTSFVSR